MDSGELHSPLQLRRDPQGEESAKGEQDPHPRQTSLLVQGLLIFPGSFFSFLLAVEGQEDERRQG